VPFKPQSRRTIIRAQVFLSHTYPVEVVSVLGFAPHGDATVRVRRDEVVLDDVVPQQDGIGLCACVFEPEWTLHQHWYREQKREQESSTVSV